jgi:hypothetical protein
MGRLSVLLLQLIRRKIIEERDTFEEAWNDFFGDARR